MKVPYSFAPIARERKCTAHVKAPPATVAIISQPLCRKKDERCVASAMTGDSTFCANTGFRLEKDQQVQTIVKFPASTFKFKTSSEPQSPILRNSARERLWLRNIDGWSSLQFEGCSWSFLKVGCCGLEFLHGSDL